MMETFNDNLFLLMAWVGAVSLVLVVLETRRRQV